MMTGSEESELQARVIDALYRGVSDATNFEFALQMMGDMFRCQSAALMSMDAGRPAVDIALTTGLFDDQVVRRYIQYAEVDPAPNAFARMQVGSVSTTDRILSEADHQGVFVNEFFRPMGLAETIGGLLRGGPGRFEMLGLHRGHDREAFSDQELEAVERFTPHIARALQLRRVFLAQDMRIATLEAGLDRMPAGVVLFDERGAAVFANAAIQAIARRGDGISLDRAGRIVATDVTARKRIDALIADVTMGGAGGVVAVPSSARTRPYGVLIAPAPGTYSEKFSLPPGASVIAVVHDSLHRPVAPAAMIQEVLGLPRGAAELAVALASESDLKDFAESQGITIHTARFHLRTALERTGAKGQVELVRIVIGLLRDFGLSN